MQALHHGGHGCKTAAAAAALLCVLTGVPAPVQGAEAEKIIVIGTTPVRQDDLDAGDFPGRIQSAGSKELGASVSADISGYLNRYFGGVHINSAQGNPLQVDLYYRGFAASPLLGLPMGMAVYQNGVRLNEPLGDTVNWDLVPMNAVAGLSLLSGSNPLYGLNTLGGAIVIEMKNGFTHPGHAVEAEGGSYERFIGNFESGGNNGEFAWYVNAQRFYEGGWRDLSKSWAENLYASFDWRGDGATLGLNYHRGRSDLKGNGLLPAGLLDGERDAIFTAPDITENDMYLWALRGDYQIGDDVRLSGNLYYRDNATDSFNGDGAEEELIDPADPMDRVQACEDISCDAVNNISERSQRAHGGVLELDFPLDWFGLQHDLNAGMGYYEGRSTFDSRVQYATLDPNTRSTRGPRSVAGAFSDDDDDITDVKTRVKRTYLYLGDSISVGDAWTVNLAGFYHDSEIRLTDRTGDQPELNGSHDYDNFNWSTGAVWHWRSDTDFYGSYSESSRLPTPIELACSEEILAARAASGGGDEVECRLPNAFLADPPLDEVISETFEFGVRGAAANGWLWSLGAFHTENNDDIIWQTTGRAHGAFRNVDKTRRVGLEASLAGDYGRLDWRLNYTWLEATFEDDFEALVSEDYAALGATVREVCPNRGTGCAAADMVEVASVGKGDDIPGIPQHLFKAAADYAFTDRFSMGVDMIAVSDSHLRGDESNQLDEVSGYAVFNARANYRAGGFEAFVLVENLFDRDYENFGLIGEEPELGREVGGDPSVLELDDERALYYAPGAPLSVWGGVRWRF
ncbi:MAG: TonB-dependent receptor [Gammaproteobacteria bacterium]|nr:TonB-dependent receptor [Gammaproteobacteria bacterium]